jgi:histidinol-phosphate aminotransferase
MLNPAHLNPRLQQVPRYVAGKTPEELEQELGLSGLIKMASNENACGPSPLAVEAAHKALSQAHRYPGGSERQLRQAIARHTDESLSLHHVLTGNGASEIIRLLAQGFAFDGAELITAQVTFPMYPICVTQFGGKTIGIPLTADYQFDLSAMAAAITSKTRLIVICNPNNPTGQVLSKIDINSFLEKIPPEILVCFDESYREFLDDPTLFDPCKYVIEGKNVIVLRSFSKCAGLANLRIGYAISTPEIISYLSCGLTPHHMGAVAIAAAIASLSDDAFRKTSREWVLSERKFVQDGLTEIGVKHLKTQTNFLLLFDLPWDSMTCYELLLRKGIIIRPMKGWGLERSIRVSLGTHEQNIKFLQAMKQLLTESSSETRTDFQMAK